MDRHFLRGQVSINTSEMPFVLAGHRAPGADLHPQPLSQGQVLSLVPADSVLIGSCLFPSVFRILIKKEPSLSLYPSWTIAGQGLAGSWSPRPLYLGPGLRLRTWPIAALQGQQQRMISNCLLLSPSSPTEFSCLGGASGPTS